MDIRFNVSPAKRFLFFFCAAFLCMLVGSVIVAIIMHGGSTAPRLRCATVVQDIVMFILPAVMTAVVVTRRPADFLMMRKAPVSAYPLAIAILLAAVPAMNAIIAWNEALTLPASMAGVEQWMRAAESQAAGAINTLMGGTGIGSLIVILLIAGILAGFSEELFFRGTLQRLIATSGAGVHVAVWCTAVVFSAVHMQFFGFFPRLLLGAYFGYVVIWTGSLWPAVWAHVLNNSLAVCSLWLEARGGMFLGSLPGFNESNLSPVSAVVSFLCTAALLFLTFRICRRRQ